VCYFRNVFGPFDESIGEILQEIDCGFLSSLGPDVVFHVKILYLLNLFCNYRYFCVTPNSQSKQVS